MHEARFRIMQGRQPKIYRKTHQTQKDVNARSKISDNAGRPVHMSLRQDL